VEASLQLTAIFLQPQQALDGSGPQPAEPGDPKPRPQLHALRRPSLISILAMTACGHDVTTISPGTFFKGRRGIAFPRTHRVVILPGEAGGRQKCCIWASRHPRRRFTVSHGRLQHANSEEQGIQAGAAFLERKVLLQSHVKI